MHSHSYPHRQPTAHAVDWARLARWIGAIAGMLLLMLAVAPSAPARSARARAAGERRAGAPCVSAAADPLSGVLENHSLTRNPSRGPGDHLPGLVDLSDLDDEDDDDARDDIAQANCLAALKDALGLRRSRTPRGSPVPEGSPLATRYLTESVRRM